MYLAIDIGGTKTAVALLNNDGVISEQLRFPTPPHYPVFVKDLADNVAKISTKDFVACGVGVPGRLDRTHGMGLAMGNLPWKNVPIKADVAGVAGCPIVIENDANLAGLSEAMLLRHKYNRVLYVTISTGIGTGFVVNQELEPAFLDSEGGQVLVEHQGKTIYWEDLASGEAIVRRYGKFAKDIGDKATWRHIAHDISLGLSDLITIFQPDVIVLGGSIGIYFDHYKEPLIEALHRYELPISPVPPVIAAARPDDAVLYGCYDLAKSCYGKSRS